MTIAMMSWATLAITLAVSALSLTRPSSTRYQIFAVANLVVGPLVLGQSFLVLLLVSLTNYFLIPVLKKKRRPFVLLSCIAFSLIPLLIVRSDWSYDWKKIWFSLALCFFCLQQIGALIELYYSRAEPPIGVLHWLAFSLFYPSLIAGPIGRWHEFRGALLSPTPFSQERGREALLLMAQGLFKKMTLAAPCMFLIERFIIDPIHYGPYIGIAMAALLRYGLWADISAYTDWARGTSTLLGINLRPNFVRPFQTIRLTEFWRRWHMAHSTWIQDYVFLPLSLSKLRRIVPPKIAIMISILTAFLALGLWHGLTWGALVMGLINGTGLILSAALFTIVDKQTSNRIDSSKIKRAFTFIFTRILAIAILCLFLVLPSLLFRVSLEQASELVKALFSGDPNLWVRSGELWQELQSIDDGRFKIPMLLWPYPLIALAWEVVQWTGRNGLTTSLAAPAYAEGWSWRKEYRIILIFTVFVIWLLFASFESNLDYAYVRH